MTAARAAGSTRAPTAARTGRRSRAIRACRAACSGEIGVSRRGEQSAASCTRSFRRRTAACSAPTTAARTWKRVNDQVELRQRAFYYMAIYADPTNPKSVYVPNVDGALGIARRRQDVHACCIRRTATTTSSGSTRTTRKILLDGNDGGATVSTDGGETWSSEHNQPTGQFYHVALDEQFPFHVYGAQQDEGAFEGPSAMPGGDDPRRRLARRRAGREHVRRARAGTIPTSLTAAATTADSALQPDDGTVRDVSPWPRYMAGASAAEQKYRFGWTHPIFFSPADPHELLSASQYVLTSDD